LRISFFSLGSLADGLRYARLKRHCRRQPLACL